MLGKGRSITKSYTKAELEQLYYDVVAVGTTLVAPDRMPNLGPMASIAVAGIAALISAQLGIMDNDDALYVDMQDIPTFSFGDNE